MKFMLTETLPQIDRTIKLEPVTYVCPVTGDTWKREGFEIKCSNNLVRTGENYDDSLRLVPQGYRMAAHEIFMYLAQAIEKLKASNESPREVLKDPIFDRQIRGNPFIWEYTHMLLKPPNGAEDFRKYVETDGKRRYSRIDIFHGERLYAEGALMPWGNWSKVVEINPALGIVAVVSDEDEPQHTMHSWFSPEYSEIAVGLDGHCNYDKYGGCLLFTARYGRSEGAGPGSGVRLVQGSLDEIPLPNIDNNK